LVLRRDIGLPKGAPAVYFMRETAQWSLLILEWDTWDDLDFLELPELEDDLEDEREEPADE